MNTIEFGFSQKGFANLPWLEKKQKKTSYLDVSKLLLIFLPISSPRFACVMLFVLRVVRCKSKKSSTKWRPVSDVKMAALIYFGGGAVVSAGVTHRVCVRVWHQAIPRMKLMRMRKMRS